jgi:hypothetical protein
MAKFSIDSKLGDIVKDPAAKAVLDEFVPGASTNPQIKMAFGMTLKAVAGFPQAKISKELLAKIDEKLKALG